MADENAEQKDDYPWKYDSNPVPWWLALIWLAYFVWGVAYLVLYLI